MICPRCQAPVGADLCCLQCRLDLAPFRRHLGLLYLLSFCFFASTLVYGGLVYWLDTRHLARAVSAAPAALPYALLVVAVLLFGAAVKVGQRLPETTGLGALQRLFTVRLALVEAIAVCGLVTYLLLGSLQWFASFLTLSLLGFLFVGAQMPAVAEQLLRLAVAEAAQRTPVRPGPPPEERDS